MAENKKQLVKFAGKCMYAQVYPGQERAPHKDAVKKDPHTAEDRHYVITVECSQDLYEKLIKAGISRMVQLKTFDDYEELKGKHFISVKCSKKRTKKETGEMFTFEDPLVIDKDGVQMTPDTLIGNCSEVEVIAELADIGHFKALRLKEIKVTHLVPYIRAAHQGEVAFEEETKKTADINVKEMF